MCASRAARRLTPELPALLDTRCCARNGRSRPAGRNHVHHAQLIGLQIGPHHTLDVLWCNRLDRVQPAGFTNTFAALQHVFSTPDRRVDEVFILSDGEPSVGPVKDPDTLLRLVRDANRYRKIRINTVFTGVGAGADFMAKLAEENHGEFVRK